MNQDASPQALAGGCPQGCTRAGTLIGLGLLALGVLTFASVTPLAIFAFIVGGIALSVSIWAALARQQSETLSVDLHCQPDRLRLGEELAFRVTVGAKRDCRLGAGTVTLRCREVAISRGGTSDTTYTHTVYEDVRELPAEDHLSAGSSWNAELALPIPRELPASYSGRNNSIEWRIVLHIAIPGPRLDISREWPLDVLPEVV